MRPPKSKLITEASWPRRKDGFRILIDGEPDEQGRQPFTLLWWQDGRRRGQCGGGVIAETKRRMIATGRKEES